RGFDGDRHHRQIIAVHPAVRVKDIFGSRGRFLSGAQFHRDTMPGVILKNLRGVENFFYADNHRIVLGRNLGDIAGGLPDYGASEYELRLIFFGGGRSGASGRSLRHAVPPFPINFFRTFGREYTYYWARKQPGFSRRDSPGGILPAW